MCNCLQQINAHLKCKNEQLTEKWKLTPNRFRFIPPPSIRVYILQAALIRNLWQAEKKYNWSNLILFIISEAPTNCNNVNIVYSKQLDIKPFERMLWF